MDQNTESDYRVVDRTQSQGQTRGIERVRHRLEKSPN